MSHYKSNVRDQVFNLFEVLGLDKALGEGEYSDLDADTAREMLAEMSRLAEGPIAELRRTPDGTERSLEALFLSLVGAGRDPGRGLDWLGAPP